MPEIPCESQGAKQTEMPQCPASPSGYNSLPHCCYDTSNVITEFTYYTAQI